MACGEDDVMVESGGDTYCVYREK